MQSGAETDHEVHHRTVVFTDFTDSASIIDQLGDDQWFELIQRHHCVAEDLSAQLDGCGVASTGDGVCAVFRFAEQARFFAIDMLDALHGFELVDGRYTKLRVGIATGSVHRWRQDYFGRTMHLAARLNGVAAPGQAVLDEHTTALLRQAGVDVALHGVLELRGFAGTQATFAIDTRTAAIDTVSPR